MISIAIYVPYLLDIGFKDLAVIFPTFLTALTIVTAATVLPSSIVRAYTTRHRHPRYRSAHTLTLSWKPIDISMTAVITHVFSTDLTVSLLRGYIRELTAPIRAVND
jgi:hypothetical protein